ncbi:MAG: helix-turn-helix transcriptional regulator [Nocardioidaceae bacterium]
MNETRGADNLLTPQELAELCRVPLATVYRWNARGGGPATIAIGRHVRYSRAEVERWLATRTTSADA